MKVKFRTRKCPLNPSDDIIRRGGLIFLSMAEKIIFTASVKRVGGLQFV